MRRGRGVAARGRIAARAAGRLSGRLSRRTGGGCGGAAGERCRRVGVDRPSPWDLPTAIATRRGWDGRRLSRAGQQTEPSLNHPHILTVHDAGEFEGRQYLVTEFVDGGTLRGWEQEASRGWRQTIELLTGVADGLAA